MSVKAISWAHSQRTRSPSAQLILVLMANYADDDGEFFINPGHLANAARVTSAQLADDLGYLFDVGLFSPGGNRGNLHLDHSCNDVAPE